MLQMQTLLNYNWLMDSKGITMKIFNNLICRLLSLIIGSLILNGLTSSVYAETISKTGNFSNGSKVWAQNCNRCHNMRGPKELRDDQWISTSFHMRMRAGLTGQETRDVIAFLQASNTKSVKIKSLPVEKIITKNVSSGKNIYEKTCVACHGANGKGVLPGAPDFLKSDGVLLKTDKVLINNILNGFQSPGSAMAMPPKGGNQNLTTADIELVLKYIRDTFSK